ncbi:hypothetical protein DF185_09375 [Marinifilum breve]|uniref:Uncharacterized protein n=1 Tax=Marinifilum breve TaxID=2184082 RepID=A0A2V3ZZ17_9BACT|nr:hypothetical protein [Marinifilum breve]PXY01668.1 hypothetical protein DF185_09375 [Marinifilum breve]
MKKIVLLAMGFMMTLSVVNAQNKVTKRIDMADWVNQAVVDANNVGGGVHLYATWTALETAAKNNKKFGGGMVVSVAGDLYKLGGAENAEITETDLKKKDQWSYIGPMKKVADTGARLALINADGASDLPLLSPGTVVKVEDADGSGNPATYVFNGTANGKYAVGDTDNEKKEVYWTNITASGVEGYFYQKGELAAAATAVTDLDKGTDKLVVLPASTEITVTNGKFVAIAFPKAWRAPNFTLDVDGTKYVFNDCWTVTEVVEAGVKYQVWSSDIEIGATGDGKVYKIIVK